jgi:hypothetical protein
LVRLSVIKDFISAAGLRPFNAKIYKILVGVTNISGLLGAHNKPVGQLNVPALKEKLAEARQVLNLKRCEYLRKLMKDERGRHVLPTPGVTEDGLDKLNTAQLAQTQQALWLLRRRRSIASRRRRLGRF